MLGACILAPTLGNIVLIDVFYGVDLEATVFAILLLAAVLSLIVPEGRKLIAFFWPPRTGLADSTALRVAPWFVRFAMLALTFGATYWLANVNNRNPTPLDGAWKVVQVDPPSLAGQVPQTIFFEFNRAGMAVFKSGAGEYQQHDFDLDPSTHRLRVWQKWMDRSSQIFEGTKGVSGSRPKFWR